MEHKLIANVLAAGAACLLASAAPAAAAPYFTLDYNKTANTGWVMYESLDYAATSANGSLHAFSNNFTPNPGSVGAKYYEMNFHTINANGQCFELRTSGSVGAVDPKLWTRTGPGINGGFVAVADDVNGTHVAARIWMKGNTSSYSTNTLYLAAFNTAYNSMQIFIDLARLEGVGEATCTTNQGLPWVKFINGVRTNGSTR